MMLDRIQNIFFLGIGGIGMSALARYFHREGKEIFGYDKVKTALTEKLVDEGMQIHYKDDVSLLPKQIDMVIYTPAIPDDNTEFLWVKEQHLPLYKRAQVLGMISKSKKVIGVAGTHGKTSTSALMADIFPKSGLSTTAFVGGIMIETNGNFIHGESDYVIVEADEFDRSFLRLYPEIAVIQAMDADHLDIYGTKDELEQSFLEYSLQINVGGRLWIASDLVDRIPDKVMDDLQSRNIAVRSFGIESGDLSARDVRVAQGKFFFDVYENDLRRGGIEFPMAGRHNIRNALAAIGVGLSLGLSFEKMQSALSIFKGVKRRYEHVYNSDSLVIIDDYAHHPVEIRAAIEATRELHPAKRITTVFQPHLYSRTKDFAAEFASALSKADRVYLTEIYPARELPMEGVSSSLIYEDINLHKKYLISKKDIPKEIRISDHEVILILGAGDIDLQIPKLLEQL